MLIACGFLAQPSLGTLPNIPPGSDPGLLGKWLVARARARVRGEPIPTIEDLMPKPEPKMEVELQPVNVPVAEDVDGNNNDMRDMENQIIEDENDAMFAEQRFAEESFVGNQRRNKPVPNSQSENDSHLKPGKHYPEGYPDRADNSKTKQVIFPFHSDDSTRNMHRVLDSPLPKPGEGPTYTVFVRASEHPSQGPTVHIVKHSVQSIMPIETHEDAMRISNHKVPHTLAGTTANMKRPVTHIDNPEDVLVAAKRDLIFRSGNLYGVPNRGGFGHQDPYDAFGHDSRHVHINLADFDSPGGYGHGGLGGLGQKGIGPGVLGHGYGHEGLSHGYGHEGLSHGYSHGGLGHESLSHGYGYGGIGSLSHSGLGSLSHAGLGHGQYGHGGFSHGDYAHGAYNQGAYGQGVHAQDVVDHDTYGHSTFSESTHGESLHGHSGFGLGIHGNQNYGHYGAGEFDQGYSGYGLRTSETPNANVSYVKL